MSKANSEMLTNLYEMCLKEAEKRLFNSILEHENMQKVMDSRILEELQQAKDRIFNEFGMEKGQAIAFTISLQKFLLEDLIKLSILLVACELSSAAKVIDFTGRSEKEFQLDCAEGFAQKLQSYANESSMSSITTLLDSKSEWGNSVLDNFENIPKKES